MNRKVIVLGVVAAVVCVVGIVTVALYSDSGDQGSGGTIVLPPAQDAGGVPTPTVDPVPEAPGAGAVDPSVTAADPVPDDLLSVLFGLIEEEGDAPLMNETYTVEFVETTDRVRIEGTFENGPAKYEFEFDDGAWKLEQSSE